MYIPQPYPPTLQNPMKRFFFLFRENFKKQMEIEIV